MEGEGRVKDKDRDPKQGEKFVMWLGHNKELVRGKMCLSTSTGVDEVEENTG